MQGRLIRGELQLARVHYTALHTQHHEVAIYADGRTARPENATKQFFRRHNKGDCRFDGGITSRHNIYQRIYGLTSHNMYR